MICIIYNVIKSTPRLRLEFDNNNSNNNNNNIKSNNNSN